MESVLNIAKYLIENGPAIITATLAVCAALVALFMLIPGEQPEKFLQSVVDFLGKFSLKPKAKDEASKG